MNRTRKLLAIGSTVVAFGGIGAIAAVAQTSSSTKPAVVTPATPKETDTLQQGDQTTPDVPGATETPEPTAKAAVGAKAAPAEATGTSETETANDGPGGHEDPAGTVDHQFDGQE